MILDKNLQRSKWFVSGWLFITLPFLVYHTISYGNPLEALTTQSSFAINGISQTLGTYNSEQWWMDYNLEITGIGILGALSGMGVLFYRNKSELSSVLVILIPFIIIHAFILDYGTARYQIPLFALTVVLIIVSLPKVEQGLNPKLKNLNEILSTFGVVAIIYLSSIHASTINEEKIQYSTLVPRMDNIMEFYLNSSEMFPEDETVLTSKYIPIALHTGKQTARYLPTEDPLTDSLVDNEFNYALTSNYYPYRAWEKDFKPFFGNPIIEPIDFYRNENGTSILWEKGNDLWSNFPINFTTNGSLYGNMLELKHTQSAYFEQNTTIYWISQTSDINIENIVELYLDRTSEIGNQSCDFTTISGFCHLELGEILNATEQDIYIWIVKFT